MQRVRDDLDIFSPDVSKYAFESDGDYSEDSPRIISLKDELASCLKPLEMRVSKSKEKGKGYGRFMLFCNRNLRLYNNVREYLLDLSELNQNSTSVDKRVNKIRELTGVNIDLIQNEFGSHDSFILGDSGESLWEDDAIGF